MKKGYIRTEIIKYLNNLEKNNNRPLTVEDVYNNLQNLYNMLQSDTEAGMEACSFNEFQQWAAIGHQNCQFQGFQFHV